MKLPPHTSVSDETIAAIRARHGLPPGGFAALPDAGIINAIYRLGDGYALRVPRESPAHIEQTLREAIAAPIARAAGVRTPRLVAFDDRRDLIAVPYSIFEWADGDNFEYLDLDPDGVAEVWRDVGRDLARLHSVDEAGALRAADPLPDPRSLADDRASDGWFTVTEARWLTKWLDHIAAVMPASVPARLLHQDTQATNVIVRGHDHEYAALIDWGCAALGDEAYDFTMPMRAVPHVLAGHREIAPLDADETAEARILWRRLQMILLILPRGATPGLSWVEHPIAQLLELMRFLFDTEDARWRELRRDGR